MQVYVVDGTYELFRHYYGAPPRQDVDGHEVGAVRGVLTSMLRLLRDGATHIGMATDHVIESFRNDMYEGYKHGEGIDPQLLAQFHPLEEAIEALGITVWPTIEFEADDAMASAATLLAGFPQVDKVFLCTPDKDLAQCVVGERIVVFDRRAGVVRGDAGVREKFGVAPASIPDYLALVGDASDGYPGLRGWGAKSTAAVLSRYGYLEAIPHDEAAWDLRVRGAARLAEALREGWQDALLFRDLATLRTEAVRLSDPEELRWRGPTGEFAPRCEQLGDPGLAGQAERLATARR